MDKLFNEHSIVALNVTKSTTRSEIADKLAEFGEIIKLRTIPMPNSNKMMTFCRYTDSLAVINSVRASGRDNNKCTT